MKKTIDQFHASSYNELFSYFDSYNRRLVSVLQPLLEFEPQYILDLACGVGLSTIALHSSFPTAKILGVDIDENLINLAKTNFQHPEVEFQCSEILDLLSKTPERTVDLIFVKSAYHYFEHQITLSHFQPLLSEKGVIVVAERTYRSVKSYPLPDIVSSYWADIFAEPRPSRRLEASDLSGMLLSVSCYGETVTVPKTAYFNAAKQNQLVGLWMVKPEIVVDWIEQQATQDTNDFRIFEEFWLYLYRNSIASFEL